MVGTPCARGWGGALGVWRDGSRARGRGQVDRSPGGVSMVGTRGARRSRWWASGPGEPRRHKKCAHVPHASVSVNVSVNGV